MVKSYTNYPVGDFLIRIKNAALANLKEVTVVSTKQIVSVAEVLKKEGFLENYSRNQNLLIANLAYRRKRPVILDIKLLSKPGLRTYMNVRDIGKKRGPSILLVSTPVGVLTSSAALKKRVGGEVIVEIF